MHQYLRFAKKKTHTFCIVQKKCSKLSVTRKRTLTQVWAKRTIKSVASWWWLNVHDEKCTDGFDIPDWIKKFPVVKMNETYDELKL